MKNKKKILIILVSVLLVIGGGITFAYYIVGASITGKGQNVEGEPSNGLQVVYNAGSSKLETEEFYPSKKISKEFTVSLTPTKNMKEVIYAIKLNISENTFERCSDSNYDDITNACTKDAKEVVYKLKDNAGKILAEGDLTSGVTGNIVLKKEKKVVDAPTGFRYTIELEFIETNADQNHNMNKVINGDVGVEFAEPDANEYILSKVEVKEGATEFTGIATDTDTGVFSGTDDDGTTYYWRGNVTNNYLKFANKWWRIIRINGDGSIRLIYDGTEYHANGTSTTDSQIGTSAFNTNYNDNAYEGFMYGTPGSITYEATHANINKSNVMEQLETWYTNNLVSYESRIDTNAGFCGDRSININNTSWASWDTKKGYGINATAYGPFNRVLPGGSWGIAQVPTFSCSNSNDLYTISGASKGNKALDKPIGLITADEVIYGGGFGNKSNSSYYLYNGQDYWTLSPSSLYEIGYAHVFYVDNYGLLTNYNVDNNSVNIRPVINLRADVQITGSGTETDPFAVS